MWTIADIPPQIGKLALVTGANSGIGWHTALELARAGSEVILTARTEANGKQAIARLKAELPLAKVRYRNSRPRQSPLRSRLRRTHQLRIQTRSLNQ